MFTTIAELVTPDNNVLYIFFLKIKTIFIKNI